MVARAAGAVAAGLLLAAACASPPDSAPAQSAAVTDSARAPAPAAPEPAGRRMEPVPIPLTPPAVRTYVAHRVTRGPAIDGRLDDPAWRDVAWTEAFTDIEGPRRPAPRLLTRAKLAWDEAYFYVGAALEEPQLQGSLVKRDTIIYLDNDFEVFLDPDGDTHDYFELEVNALGTEWDLRLPRPYRDGGQADNEWDIAGLRTAVRLEGTLNDPSDEDAGWSIEIAIPFAALERQPPEDGDQWRVNFSRVQWELDTAGGAYRKRVEADTGRPLAENNWVWSPQFAVNMHMPEMWGIVQFGAQASGGESVPVPVLEDHAARWSLRRAYYAQRAFRREHGRWAAHLDELGLTGLPAGIRLVPGRAEVDAARDGPDDGWRASVRGASGATWWIRADGRTWRE